MQIYKQTTGQRVCGSLSGNQCCWRDLAYESGTYTFIAYVARDGATNPPPDIQAASNPVTVTGSRLGGMVPSASWPSEQCKASSGWLPITDIGVFGGRVTIDVAQTATDTSICYRIDAGSVHSGGRLSQHLTALHVGSSLFLVALAPEYRGQRDRRRDGRWRRHPAHATDRFVGGPSPFVRHWRRCRGLRRWSR